MSRRYAVVTLALTTRLTTYHAGILLLSNNLRLFYCAANDDVAVRQLGDLLSRRCRSPFFRSPILFEIINKKEMDV